MLLGDSGKSKKIATIIIGKMKGGETSGEEYKADSGMQEDEEGMDAGSALKAASRSVMTAIKDGDESMLADALQTFFEHCYENHEKSEEQSQEAKSGEY